MSFHNLRVPFMVLCLLALLQHRVLSVISIDDVVYSDIAIDSGN